MKIFDKIKNEERKITDIVDYVKPITNSNLISNDDEMMKNRLDNHKFFKFLTLNVSPMENNKKKIDNNFEIHEKLTTDQDKGNHNNIYLTNSNKYSKSFNILNKSSLESL